LGAGLDFSAAGIFLGAGLDFSAAGIFLGAGLGLAFTDAGFFGFAAVARFAA
jgi:hypothetical protein